MRGDLKSGTNLSAMLFSISSNRRRSCKQSIKVSSRHLLDTAYHFVDGMLNCSKELGYFFLVFFAGWRASVILRGEFLTPLDLEFIAWVGVIILDVKNWLEQNGACPLIHHQVMIFCPWVAVKFHFVLCLCFTEFGPKFVPI